MGLLKHRQKGVSFGFPRTQEAMKPESRMWAVECDGEAPKVSFGFFGLLVGVFFVGDLAGYCIGRWCFILCFLGVFWGVLLVGRIGLGFR